MRNGHDFWKESERRYREARRLMDEIYYSSLPAPEGAGMSIWPPGEVVSCRARDLLDDGAPWPDIPARPAGKPLPLAVVR